jgi:Protein of unknown function (DUF2778)
MWTYQQSTGNLTAPDGSLAGQGYSGNGADLDNPSAEAVIGHGPIPQGAWTIGAFETYPHLGEVVAPLLPCEGNTMDGREGGFFIHGDNAAMDHTASDGCIVLSRALREMIAESGDIDLEVIA